MVEFLVGYWWLLLVCIAGGAVGGVAAYNFITKPFNTQLENVKEWLLYAVTLAEKELGGGTGQLKLRQVYDAFVTKFPLVAKVLTFNKFSDMVDEALDKFKSMLKSNTNVQSYVEGN